MSCRTSVASKPVRISSHPYGTEVDTLSIAYIIISWWISYPIVYNVHA